MHFDKDAARILYDVGASMIEDDKSDLGWTTYSQRRLHHYHGHRATEHSTPFHHWQLGTLLCLTAQFLALAQTAQEAHDVFQEMQSELSQESSESDAAGSISAQ